MKLHTIGDHKLVKLKSYTLALLLKAKFKICVRKFWTIAIDYTLFLHTYIRVYSLYAQSSEQLYDTNFTFYLGNEFPCVGFQFFQIMIQLGM